MLQPTSNPTPQPTQRGASKRSPLLRAGLTALTFLFIATGSTTAATGQARLEKKRARKAAAGRIPPAEGMSHCEGDHCEFRFTWGYDSYTYECGTSLQARTVYQPNTRKPEVLSSNERLELLTLKGQEALSRSYDADRKQELERKQRDAEDTPAYVPATVLYTQPDYCSANDGSLSVVADSGRFFLRYESYSALTEHDACKITVERSGSSQTYTCEKEPGQNAWRAEVPASELINLLGRLAKKSALERFMDDNPSLAVTVHGEKIKVNFDGPHYRYQVEDFVERH